MRKRKHKKMVDDSSDDDVDPVSTGFLKQNIQASMLFWHRMPLLLASCFCNPNIEILVSIELLY